MTTKTCCFVSALLFAQLGRADAQGNRVRHGLWLEVGLGDGLAHFSSDTTPRSQTRNGADCTFDLGWTFGSRVRAGVSLGQWTSRLGAGKQTWLTRYGVSAYYYPIAHRTAFLQVGAGGSYYARVHVPWQFLGADQADTTYLSGTAWGATVAAGWDAPLGRRFALRPRLVYSYGAPRNVHSADGSLLATHWKHDLVALDVGVVLHPADSW